MRKSTLEFFQIALAGILHSASKDGINLERCVSEVIRQLNDCILCVCVWGMFYSNRCLLKQHRGHVAVSSLGQQALSTVGINVRWNTYPW